MARIPLDVYEARIQPALDALERAPAPEVVTDLPDEQLDVVEDSIEQLSNEPTQVEITEQSMTGGVLMNLRQSRAAQMGVAAATAMTAGIVFGLMSTNSPDSTSAAPTTNSQSKAPKPQKSSSPAPSDSIAQVNPTAQYAKLPADWQACETPRAKLLTNADLGLKVPIKLTNGKEALVYLANGAMPHVQYSGSVAIGACLKADITKSQFVIKDGVVTIPRSVFTTTSMFPAVNTKGSTAVEKVDGYNKTGALKADASKFLSAAEANRINSLLMSGGSANVVYRKSADYLVRDGLLTFLTTQHGAAISQRLDASLIAAFVKSNGKKIKYVLTGQYDSLNVHYETIAAKDFKPLTSVVPNGPISGGATIINVEKQS